MNDGIPVTLEALITKLNGYINKLTDTIGAIMQADGQRVYSVDFFALPLLNRSVKLLDGFLLLMKDKNYLCAIPLIRLQLDNSLRFYATMLATSPQDVVDAFMNGNPFHKLKDRNGEKMTDSHLATELDKLFPGVKKLYSDTSGYVHLSDSHFYAIIIRSGEGQEG